jgi:hypothetical protein
MQVSADGIGLVSRSGVALLRELADRSGLVGGWTAALADTYDGPWLHPPGQVLADLAVMIADGGDAISHLGVLRDQAKLFGSVASDPTAWRALHRVDAEHLPAIQAVRAAARERVWAAGGGPDLSGELVLDFDATVTVAHSEKENAAATWKRTFGFHPLLCYLDRPDISGGEALAGLLRAGNAGSNTTADHVMVLDLALRALPAAARPRPADPTGPRLLARSDSAGATHGFAAALRERAVAFSLGFPVDARVQAAVLALPRQAWRRAVNGDDSARPGAWVAELTSRVDLTGWPPGARLIVRKERPHPGAQLTFTDADGHRVTAFITDTPGGRLPELERRHRTHARVEDRIRTGKDTGLRNLPCHGFAENAAWLELALAAADLLSWTQALCLTGELARAEPAALRYRLLAIAGRISRSGRLLRLRLDRDWPWARHLQTAFDRLRAAPWPA